MAHGKFTFCSSIKDLLVSEKMIVLLKLHFSKYGTASLSNYIVSEQWYGGFYAVCILVSLLLYFLDTHLLHEIIFILLLSWSCSCMLKYCPNLISNAACTLDELGF